MDGLDRGWQMKKSLAECNTYMLEKKIACDVKISFHTHDGACVELQAHKYMLISRSPVFEAMLSGSYLESSDSIKITDIEPDVFKEVLRYIYSEQVELTVDNVLHVMFAAKKYFIGGLFDQTEQFLMENMNENNVCTILNSCLHYMDSDLSTKCLCYIARNSEATFNSEDFFNLSQEALCAILQNNSIKLKTELEIFEHCLNWAKCQIGREGCDIADLRTVLGECLFQIRFHMMSSKDIAESVTLSGVLTSDELLAIFCHLATDDQEARLEKLGFNMKSRHMLLSDFTMWTRFRSVEQDDMRWQYNDELDCISFMADKDIIVHGLCVYGGYFKGDFHKAHIKLFDAGCQDWIAEKYLEFVADGLKEHVALFFDKPVFLEADQWHAAALQMSGPNTYFGEGGSESVFVDGIQLSFGLHDEDINGTDTYSGQIPMILFKPANNS